MSPDFTNTYKNDTRNFNRKFFFIHTIFCKWGENFEGEDYKNMLISTFVNNQWIG